MPRSEPPRQARSAPAQKLERNMTLTEWVADYFSPGKEETIVRRGELARILVNYHNVQQSRTLWSRVKRAAQKYYIASARAPISEKPE